MFGISKYKSPINLVTKKQWRLQWYHYLSESLKPATWKWSLPKHFYFICSFNCNKRRFGPCSWTNISRAYWRLYIVTMNWQRKGNMWTCYTCQANSVTVTTVHMILHLLTILCRPVSPILSIITNITLQFLNILCLPAYWRISIITNITLQFLNIFCLPAYWRLWIFTINWLRSELVTPVSPI